MLALDRLTSLPLVLLHSCLHLADTPTLLRFGRSNRAALTAVDQPLAWTDQHEDGDDDDEDDSSDAEIDRTDGRSVVTSTSALAAAAPVPSTCTASLSPLTLGRRKKRQGPRVVLLHSQHTRHLTHPSLVRAHAAIDFVSYAATGDDMRLMASHFGLMKWSILDRDKAASKEFPRLDAETEFTALSQVQHLERLFVSRSTEVGQSLDDDRLQALIQLPHIRRSLRGVYFVHQGNGNKRYKRPLFNACHGYVPPVRSDRAPSIYLSLPTLQLMGALPHLHTLCISDGGTAYGVLPMLHRYMPQLTTLAFMEIRMFPELPSSDVMSIGLCPRLHTLLITGSYRWNTSGMEPGHLFLPFFSQPMLQRNLRRLHLIGDFQVDDVLVPALRGLRALRTIACDFMQDSILPAFGELTREDPIRYDQLQIRSHQPRHSTRSDHAENCTGAGAESVGAGFVRSQLRQLVIFGKVRETTFTSLFSGVPTDSPLMVYFRPHCSIPKFTPVESVCRFQAAEQMADVETVHRATGAVDPAHLARLVVCPKQPQMYGPAQLHRSLTNYWCDLLQFDWLRLDRAHILPFTLPPAVATMHDPVLGLIRPDPVSKHAVSSLDAAAAPVEKNRYRCSVGTCTRQFSSEAALQMHHQAKHTPKPTIAAAAAAAPAPAAPTRPTSSCHQRPAFTFDAIGAGFTAGVSSSPSAGVGVGSALSSAPLLSTSTDTGTDAAVAAITAVTPARRVILKAKRRAPNESSGDGGGK